MSANPTEFYSVYEAELRTRHDTGALGDVQFWSAMLGMAGGYAQQGRFEDAVRVLRCVPARFLRALSVLEQPLLAEAVIELGGLLAAAGYGISGVVG